MAFMREFTRCYVLDGNEAKPPWAHNGRCASPLCRYLDSIRFISPLLTPLAALLTTIAIRL